ncbi:hypothetical protein ACFVAJ_17475 [Agromyces sp. NPDC057679]|uniref:hypothetical protein n=1 Tax=Agromyces sp. NPDC057679 TaxID=3346207 RepID=UPI00366E3603
MATTKPTERFPEKGPKNHYGETIFGQRKRGEAIGTIRTFGRTSKAYRQEVADGMAAITETATVVQLSASEYRVDFEVTHRILPIDGSTT